MGHATYAEACSAVAVILGEARPFPPQVGEINQQILKGRIQAKAQKYRLAEEARLKALPPPDAILEPEARDRCLKLLSDCVVSIAKKKRMN